MGQKSRPLMGDKTQDFNILIEELTKDSPNLVLVREKMEAVGLLFSDDPIERLNRVLMALHPQIQDDAREVEA